MIISIAEKCSEGCSHCFINSLPRSPVMDRETLGQVVGFLKWARQVRVMVSGGEFTEHPEFLDYVMRIIVEARRPFGLPLSLLSNGSWFFDDDRRRDVERLLAMDDVLFLQVRTHPKYYTNYERTIAARREMESLSSKIIFFDDGIRLVPLGRARANHAGEEETRYPPCANLFLIAKQAAVSFVDLLRLLDERNINCKPFISSLGVIHAGETPYCEEIGRVTDDDRTIYLNIMTRCRPKNRCGLAGNLEAAARGIIYDRPGMLPATQ